MLGFKIKDNIINLDVAKRIALKQEKICFYYQEDFTNCYCLDSEEEAKQLFEKIERLTCENKIQ